jgi:hypothetical protein
VCLPQGRTSNRFEILTVLSGGIQMRRTGTRQPARKNISLEIYDACSDVISAGVFIFSGLLMSSNHTQTSTNEN